MEIVDFYFGTMDGVDTFATGHPADRVLEDPGLWEDEKWVAKVFERMLFFRGSL